MGGLNNYKERSFPLLFCFGLGSVFGTFWNRSVEKWEWGLGNGEICVCSKKYVMGMWGFVKISYNLFSPPDEGDFLFTPFYLGFPPYCKHMFAFFYYRGGVPFLLFSNKIVLKIFTKFFLKKYRKTIDKCAYRVYNGCTIKRTETAFRNRADEGKFAGVVIAKAFTPRREGCNSIEARVALTEG